MPDALEIADWCTAGRLPDTETFYATLVDEQGLFTSIEGTFWDFKDEWPFSHSNEYFGGICRLVCAFANSYGGVIVFGVHDKKRDGGHNHVQVNIDRFQKAFSQLTGAELDLDYKQYVSNKCGNVDVLLVKQRSRFKPPIRFLNKLGPYPAGKIWVRAGHEVVEATPAHFPFLFCRADPSDAVPERDGSIPPSPATMKKFVGRVEVLDKLFGWLEFSDEPRTYLHGKGGSGKTTIAYEFARLIKDFGGNIRIEGADSIDVVIFLSAKEKALVPLTGNVEGIEEPDFSDEASLLRQILYYGEWSSDREYLNRLDLIDLRIQVTQYFDITSAVIVLDDVDTLTTKGVDPGSDWLYRILCRSKKKSKILYTLRNAPSQSLHSAIEVPGLEGPDYEAFVSACVSQFRVKAPSKQFLDTVLPSLSERRPLVIECIVALVRTSGSYERAAEHFRQHAGTNIRDYVFIREWDALTGGKLARLLLAALAELKRSVSFSELRTVLQVDDSNLQDAIGEVREMFLQIDEAGDEILFSLAPLTRAFVNSRKSTLSEYNRLMERVKAFRQTLRMTSPAVASVVSRVHRILPLRNMDHLPDNLSEALRIVSDPALPPEITEDPVFKCLLGYVCVLQNNPILNEAREAFQYALSMRHEPSFAEMRSWFNAEKANGVLDGWTIRIADAVINGRSYAESEKINMMSRKATSLFVRGRERMFTESVDSRNDTVEALILHLRVFRLNCLNGGSYAAISEQYARNTAHYLFGIITRSDSPWELFEVMSKLVVQVDVFLDPIVVPLQEALERIVRLGSREGDAQRIRNKIRSFNDTKASRDIWLEDSSSSAVARAFKNLDEALLKRVKAKNARQS